MFKAVGLHHCIENPEFLKNPDPCVIVCNHQSSLDVIGKYQFLHQL